jgi:hypothetical protein
MAQPSLSETPQEVIDGVIDLYSNDLEALMTCSLISRAWVDRARKHLFSASRLFLTSKNLSAWCAVVEAHEDSRPLAFRSQSPSYAPFPSYVTSLQFAPNISLALSGNFERALLRASIHFSAFENLSSLTLSAISIAFIAFMGAPLEACFGSFGKTVRRLKVDMCALDWKLLVFLKLFTNLEELELRENTWVDYKLLPWTSTPWNAGTVLRGSLKVSGFTDARLGFNDANIKILNSLSAGITKYHTITLGYNPPSTFSQFNTLFAKCKDYLKTFVLTKLDGGPLAEAEGQ